MGLDALGNREVEKSLSAKAVSTVSGEGHAQEMLIESSFSRRLLKEMFNYDKTR
jgi:hypothetical protein